jgi:hypothetical protein
MYVGMFISQTPGEVILGRIQVGTYKPIVNPCELPLSEPRA